MPRSVSLSPVIVPAGQSRSSTLFVLAAAAVAAVGLNSAAGASAGTAAPHSPQAAVAAAIVVDYAPGSGAAPRFMNPEAALGLPSQSNPFGEPTDPFNPPYGTNQLVSIGAGGHLTLGFDRPLLNHPNNPFGLDFTIFGNAGFIITNEFDLATFGWIGTPATDGSLFGELTGEFAVSVSANGLDYFVLNPDGAARIDSFPPTDGSGDPGVPVAPDLTAGDLAGATLDDIRRVYAGSAGGASFDINAALDASGRHVFLPQIRFIRIDAMRGRLEIDAVTVIRRVPWGHR